MYYLCSIKLLMKDSKTVCSKCMSKQFRCSLRIYLYHGEYRGLWLVFQWIPSGQTVKPLVFYTGMTQNQSPGTAGTMQKRNHSSSPAVLCPSPWVGAMVPLFPYPQTPFDGLHIRDLLISNLFVISDCAAWGLNNVSLTFPELIAYTVVYKNVRKRLGGFFDSNYRP